jgi:uncharacterized cysteine cluster protein YcgN (CxxCxxCC family)
VTETPDQRPFWKSKPLGEMSLDEWELLCDGCGKCCLNKLEDIDSGEVFHTDVACRFLDLDTCRCTDYARRTLLVPDCTELLPMNLGQLRWLPSTCAYRLLYEGRDLPSWHHLVSGSRDTVHQAGASVRGRVISERDGVDLEDHVASWPA